MGKLIDKIANKKAILGVIGLGYVGLPLAVEKAKAGYKVIGFDISNSRVNSVNNGENYIGDIVDEDLSTLVSNGSIIATENFDLISRCDCVSICVPTPLDKHQQPDISYVENSTREILKRIHKDMLVVLESTTYPGTTEELIKPILESEGLVCGSDFYLAFSPERVDPGNKSFNVKNTPKIVGGITNKCTNIASLLYESILNAPVLKVSSPAVAEMEKILENTYRNVNIGLINELAILCEKMGINIWEVIEAAKSKPYGFQAFYPGPGLGGHCIPLDPYYLSWKAREFGFHTSMIESSMMINDKMAEYCVERIYKIMNRNNKVLNHSHILVLGVAYKRDIDDYRESPSLKIINLLKTEGVNVDYYDPYIPSYIHKGVTTIGLKELNGDIIANYDMVIIATDHSTLDYKFIVQKAKLIFDTRNATKGIVESTKLTVI